MKKYIPSEIEPKWQKKWDENQIYRASKSSKKPKKYILDMFPYPSGDGLHVGHFKLYIASDVLSRFYRAMGFNVLHPMGWDAFGLPTENFAIKTGTPPAVVTAKNITNMKQQMQIVGLSYDWSREINTTDPNYYKWTQWIFLKLFKQGLAYEDEAPINWCPKDKTGLANEEVVAGRCERCGTKVETKKIRQWILKITEYADRLASDVADLEWPQFIKEMQINWIGKSKGIVIKFDELEIFTTRQDTIFGTTFIVISPEHPLLDRYIVPEKKGEVQKYLALAKPKSELERKEERKKTGVFTGSFVTNPITNEQVPVWIADYVLMSYGTGAVMGVPAHDERDFEFAKKYGLETPSVIEVDGKPTNEGFEGEGVLINSGEYTGMTTSEGREKISEYIEKHKVGSIRVNYHLRDWIFSRQRYWGEPIPLIHCEKCGIVPVPETELPLKLPEIEKYEPIGTGESPLTAIKEWVNTTCPNCGGLAKRETNTMPQWAGSCWYYLRFCDPNNDSRFVGNEVEKYWMPVDWYLGGAEHAVLHLLYSRFWHKVLYDLKLVSTPEPFKKLSSVGLVLAADGRKMSKRWSNVVKPEDVVKEYGADSLRIYETFMGPFENIISWNPRSLNGAHHFLQRIWGLFDKVVDDTKLSSADLRIMHKTIKKLTQGIEGLQLNTSVAALMEWLNYLSRKDGVAKEEYKTLLLLLAPFAPHITEQLWEIMGEKCSIHQQSWPKFTDKFLEEQTIKVVVQVNGRVRDVILIDKDMVSSKEKVEKLAMGSDKVNKFLAGKKVVKTIYVPGKVVNLCL